MSVVSHRSSLTCAFTAITLFLFSQAAQSADPNPQKIMQRVFDHKRVEDQDSTLTFRFFEPGTAEKKLVFRMLWKNEHGKNGYLNKVMFFSEYPPDQNGVAYMSWLREPGSSKEDDSWLYLPELRTVRRISHRDHKHKHDDVFGNSVLKRVHLDPRPPELDGHSVLGTEAINGRNYYVVESRPIVSNKAYPFSKTVTWVDTETYTPRRVMFIDLSELLTADMEISWLKENEKWIWEKVKGFNPTNGARTLIEVTNIKVDIGLEDTLFSKRTMKRGLKRVK